MKIIILLTVFILCFSSLKSQSKEWENVFSNSQATIKVLKKECNDIKNGINKEYLFLKFENKTSKTLTISFFTEIYYNNKCYSCGNILEYTKNITLSPNEKYEGSCSNKSPFNSIFSKMLDNTTKTSLTNYSIKDVVIKTK